MVSLPDLVLPKIKHFGLSIDRTGLRGVQIDSKQQITTSAEIIFDKELFSGNILTEQQMLVQQLQQLLIQGKFSSAYAVVTFPEAFAYSRALDLPSIKTSEVLEAVTWRIKELFPFPKEDIYFDWQILETKDDGYHIGVVAVQKKVLDPILSALISAGIKPLFFEPAGLAIARLLDIKPGVHALVTEINRNIAYVTLVEGQTALFTTLVTYHKDETVASFIQNINNTLKEIATFYVNKGVLKDNEIEIVLTGEVVSEQWLPHLAYPAKILQIAGKSPAFNKAYASAKSTALPPNDPGGINLLPASMQRFYDTERNTSFYKNMLARVVFLFGILAISSLVVFAAIRLERQRLDNQIKRLTTVTESQPSSLQRLLFLNARSQDIVALAPLRQTPSDTLDVIASVIPEEIEIVKWGYDDASIRFTLEGTAETRTALLSFKDALEQTERFAKISLPLETLETPVDIHFEISFVPK